MRIRLAFTRTGICLAIAAAFATAAVSERMAAGEAQVGDHHVTYRLAEAAANLTYRLHVPAAWRPGDHWPLVVVLHGFGGDADTPFIEAASKLQAAADAHRFIVVAPAGYDGRGDYGANLPLPAPTGGKLPPAANRSVDQVRFAEADVMAVLARVSRAYGTDPARTFLMGNSMGMTGTLHLAAKYPERWCAIAPSDGPPWPNYPAARLASLAGVMVLHGEADTRADIADSRDIARRMAAAGVKVRFVPIPDGDHPTGWTKKIPEIFAFFAGLPCGDRPSSSGRR